MLRGHDGHPIHIPFLTSSQVLAHSAQNDLISFLFFSFLFFLSFLSFIASRVPYLPTTTHCRYINLPKSPWEVHVFSSGCGGTALIQFRNSPSGGMIERNER